MNNFELIDDYLANRLNEDDKTAFEQQLHGDPALKSDVELQREIIEGVRQARIKELKTMLQNVPVNGSGWSAGKTAATLITAGIVATSLYFYLQEDPQQASPVTEVAPAITDKENKTAEPKIEAETPAKQEENQSPAVTPADQSAKKMKAAVEEKTNAPVQKPTIEVVDPSEELQNDSHTQPVSPGSRQEVTASKMEVGVNSADKKYNFHYQFQQGKLMLYGPFDKTLYEVLEINSENHLVFLYYRENYYLLDETQPKVTALSAIRDGQLLKKLKDYRGR